MRSSSTSSTIFGLALLAALAWGLWYVVRAGVGLFDGIDREATVAAFAAALTVLVAATIVANGLHAIARNAEHRERRAAQAAVYERLLRFQGADDAPAGEPAFITRQMLLYASPAVLDAWLRLRRAEEGMSTSTGVEGELAELVRQMRRELWHRPSDTGLTELGEMLALPAREPELTRADPVPGRMQAGMMELRR